MHVVVCLRVCGRSPDGDLPEAGIGRLLHGDMQMSEWNAERAVEREAATWSSCVSAHGRPDLLRLVIR